MQLKRLKLTDFRNYAQATIDLFSGVHIFYGKNGAGKTNILEAVYYLALTKSFRTAQDRHLIRYHQQMFRVEGDLINDQGQAFHCAIAYALQQGKRLTVNGQRIERFTEYIGEIPVVLLHPADLMLSQGGPANRRRFLDVLLCQSSRIYLHHLAQYNRALKQRNQLLQSEAVDGATLEAWDVQLAEHGAELMQRRQAALQELSETVASLYAELSQSPAKVKLVYRSSVPGGGEASPKEAFLAGLSGHRAADLQLGYTSLGPHRDDVLFLINGKPFRTYASQGEHKTLIVALKLAEYQFLKKHVARQPILLFDDLFGELDAQRIAQMLTYLEKIGQVLVTTTSRNFFDKVNLNQLPVHSYRVAQGTVQLEATLHE
ncbi:MAG: DNA replication/repair protein RecF [Calditrichaeota bacterium]|nr:MAG: DNA replication/repair protein RecF [Calditrichota bacterium]